MAIDCATTLPDLAAWWREHQYALSLLPPPDLARVVALKDHRKRLLQSASVMAPARHNQPRLV